ncbi:MAG: hypothetical protein H7Z71_07080 [Moraxellaceae bacterium]|nr:hypothetical protein [Pseudobdellovibrionaceae bacterium]
MKSTLLICLAFFSIHTFASTSKEISSMIVSMSNFSEKEKLRETDLPELTQQLKNILILEKLDQSHEGPFELTSSYPQNKALYQKALKSFKKDEQKTLQKILKIVEDLARDGNG